MNFQKINRTIKNLLTSSLPIGGLEISDTTLKFLLIKNTTVTQASLRLPPGIIKGGLITNEKLAVAALKNLHAQITPLQKPLPVVVTLPSQLVYAQAFSVPLVDAEHLEESINLNLQMLSPNELENSYYDYEQIKENKNLGNLDLLGAFIKSDIVDSYTSTLRAANFTAIAVEFPGLSLARLIAERWGGLAEDQQYLVISLNSQGVLLLILKNGNLYFNHFTAWGEIVASAAGSAQNITFEAIKGFLTEEIRRVLNFYIGRFGRSIEEAILVSPLFNYEIVKLSQEAFSLKIRNLSITELPNLKPNWFPALGSALRGLISRARDTAISLTKTKAQAEFYQERLLHFVSLWSNIAIGTFIFILIVYTFIDTSFAGEKERLARKTQVEFSTEDIAARSALQENLAELGKLLDMTSNIANSEKIWSNLFARLSELAGDQITIERFIASQSNNQATLAARTGSETSAIAFKNRLAEEPLFTGVSLPLSNIKTELDGTIAFSLSLRLVPTGTEGGSSSTPPVQ
ncbi:MAG: hypothetical protein COU11_04265 [Candidatus Harrisonbacteria bacterium CG10_big_fil_rev_8_21_14_0_10_49_15]|uniref:SHS2 domain-containing protein n=1 Tax=Candidatus Harrisonbacteria bacterium CG10_big_fil_rev_8_21_14_0_10_49_15 TaxID=1974587 RepID=A0A2H0ULY5_9BACT|nr:MAG: hypothetical protein COU11_04265 [Candidatus Harrisonbacteria bacterium CG10_big_fil_rev_8_21_14_0_10_49_15]